jgi:hypothetical protein
MSELKEPPLKHPRMTKAEAIQLRTLNGQITKAQDKLSLLREARRQLLKTVSKRKVRKAMLIPYAGREAVQ